MPARSSQSTFIVRQFAPFRAWIVLALGLGVVVAALGAVEPLFYRYLLDLLVGAGKTKRGGLTPTLRLAELAVAGWAAVLLAARVLQMAQSLVVNRIRFRSGFVLSGEVLSRLYGQSLAFHQRNGAGYILTRVDRGIAALGQLVSDLLQSLAPNLANLVIMAVLLLELSPRLAAVALAPMPLFLWATLSGSERMARHEEVVQEGWSRLYSRVTEVLSGIKTVKSLACEEHEVACYRQQASAIFQRLWRLVWVDEGYGQLKSLLALVGRLGVAGYGFWFVLQGRLTPGTWIAATSYASLLYGPLAGLAGTYSSIARGLVATRVVFDFLDASPAPAPELGAPLRRPRLPRLRGEVVFERVSYAFAGSDSPPAINDVSLRVAAGETVALVGPSGGGKTTLMDLLLRFHSPDRGRILVDGHDIATVEPAALRAQMAVVLQEPVLLQGSIADNLAYGMRDATLAAIRAAARAAQAEEFILRLPEGFDTKLGERGARLSGGEKQRLAIARALLRDPRILILDEATAHLDAASEAALNLALANLLRGRTALIISHRLQTLLPPDRIIVLDRGRLVESGTPTQLAASRGFYATWRAAPAAATA